MKTTALELCVFVSRLTEKGGSLKIKTVIYKSFKSQSAIVYLLRRPLNLYWAKIDNVLYEFLDSHTINSARK